MREIDAIASWRAGLVDYALPFRVSFIRDVHASAAPSANQMTNAVNSNVGFPRFAGGR